tara:strand:- start:620 stop:1297 length:678 start_codon:yes stop_codon:yes gene_type:complete
MKKILIILLSLIITESVADVKDYDKINYIEYDLYRNNKLIGYHKYEFKRRNEFLTVQSDVMFEISKLGLTLYKYNAKSEEIYKNDEFYKFTANTNQNKKEKYANISLNTNKDELVIDGSSYKGVASKDFIVGTWWNHKITEAKAQISAVSGRIIEQNVVFKGKEEIEINGKKYQALHYNFSSSDKSLSKDKKLNTDIWYDAKTKIWIQAAFDKTGFWEYRLKQIN